MSKVISIIVSSILIFLIIYLYLNVKQVERSIKANALEEVKTIAFTFDDGPSEYTLEIARELKKYNYKATFFEVGNKMYENQDIIKELINLGMEIGSHTYSHKLLTNSSISEIQNEFGIAIRYGEETNNYSINTEIGLINTVPISDPSVINKQLEHLKSALNLYPNGMFQEIKNEGIPLTVLLINNYSDGSITGITDSSYTYANISIAAVHPFEESFFHESYHYIERFLLKRGATFNSWDSFNPSEFTWGTVYNGYSYSNTFSESAPFVNNYAQTSGAEDRASTFEFMMAKSKASCLNYGTVVWKKADYMAKTIDYVFDTVSPNVVEYWERFLY